jgi:hypothetical protein
MGKIWDWHKEVWNKPILQFLYQDDGEGNKDCKMDLLGSKFFYKKEVITDKNKDIIKIEPIKEIGWLE